MRKTCAAAFSPGSLTVGLPAVSEYIGRRPTEGRTYVRLGQYKLKVDNLPKVNPKLALRPVKRLNTLLFISICAIWRIGYSVDDRLITCWVATIVCIFSATFALCMLVMTLLVIRGILDGWLTPSTQG